MNSSIPIKSGGTIELRVNKAGDIDLYAGRVLGPPIHKDVVQPTREDLGDLRIAIDRIIGSSKKITEHEMLVTLATMALKMDDHTGHDVVEALQAHGYRGVVTEARDTKKNERRQKSMLPWRVTEGTTEIVDAWRKCQLTFTLSQDAVVAGHQLYASEGASILSLDLIEPGHLLLANQSYTVRIANGRFAQHMSLTLILEKP